MGRTVAGVACGGMDHPAQPARRPVAVVVLLVALFIPVHYALWERFPLWYHLVFFVSLLLMTVLGAAVYPRENVRVHAPGSGE